MSTRIGILRRISNLRAWSRDRLALKRGTDAAGTVARVSSSATLSAENLWMLGCSAILASIGLDVGSAAVVIGAMLISPLMGPILGVGLSLGITDRSLLQRSLRELAFGTVVVLILSTLYFIITPLASATSELIARTRPTLLDVGVAFFGGVAGIVAGSRKQPSMAIPGVAIATALMPPLCTAGFGIATWNGAYFLSAFYLFALNAVFIALSTFTVVRILGFPHHEEASVEDRRRERRLIAAVTIAAALPSAYFLYDVAGDLREHRRIQQFIDREVERRGCIVPQWERVRGRHPFWRIEGEPDGDAVRIFVAGHPLAPASVDSLRGALSRYRLGGLRLEVVQSEISAESLKRLRGEVQRDMMTAIADASAARDSLERARGRDEQDRLTAAARELSSAFPEIASVTYAPRADLLGRDSTASAPTAFIAFRPRTRSRERAAILGRAQAMLRERLGAERLVVEAR